MLDFVITVNQKKYEIKKNKMENLINDDLVGFDNWLTSRSMYAYFFGVCMILDMHTLTCILIFSLRFFKVFKICLILIILYYLKT